MKPRIVAVDDDLAIRTAIVSVLSGAGYEVKESDNAIDALQLIRATRPTVVIADLHMPGFGGMEMVKKMREDDDQTPVIILTSDQEVATMNEAMLLNVHDFFNKSDSDIQLLVESVKKYAPLND